MMRKTLLMLATGALGVAAPALAQNGFGVIGGYVASKVTEDPEVVGLTWAGRSGFAGGLTAYGRLQKGVSIGLEGLYAMKGSDVHTTTATGSEKLTYIEVPLLLRFTIGQSRQPHLFVTAGGQYSVLLTCTQSAAGVVDVDCKATSTSTSGTSKSDYGVIVGGGVASGRLSLNARYDFGLANLNNDTSAGAASYKSRAFFVMLGIGLGR